MQIYPVFFCSLFNFLPRFQGLGKSVSEWLNSVAVDVDLVNYSAAEDDGDMVSSSASKRKRDAHDDGPAKKRQRTTWSKDELYGPHGVQKIKKYVFDRLKFSPLEFVFLFCLLSWPFRLLFSSISVVKSETDTGAHTLLYCPDWKTENDLLYALLFVCILHLTPFLITFIELFFRMCDTEKMFKFVTLRCFSRFWIYQFP